MIPMKGMLLILLCAGSLSAQFLEPSWRGEEETEHAHWDRFTSRTGLNYPDIAQDAPTNDAVLQNNDNGAFITGTSNIYSFLSEIIIQINDAADYPIRNVLLQARVLGSDIDLDSVLLDLDGSPLTRDDRVSPTQFRLLDTEDVVVDAGGVPNIPVSSEGRVYAFQFELSEEQATTAYSLVFRAESSSMSLDQAVIDTSGVFTDACAPDEESAPTLNIGWEEGAVVLSWPAESSATLESTSDLNDISSWTEVSASPTQEGDENRLTLASSDIPTFFRLKF